MTIQYSQIVQPDAKSTILNDEKYQNQPTPLQNRPKRNLRKV